MKKLLLLLIPAVLFSCKKKEDDPYVLQFQSYLDKYLICDSIKVNQGGVNTVVKLGKGKGYDMKFNSDNSLLIYSNPQQQYNFFLNPPDEVYYYTTDDEEKKKYTATFPSSNKMNLVAVDSVGRIVTSYLTTE